jgi:hypothetical protein
MHPASKDGTDRCTAPLTTFTSKAKRRKKKKKSFHRQATQGRTAEALYLSTALERLNNT